MEQPFLTMADLASRAGMSLATMGRRFRHGQTPETFRLGRCRFVTPAAADAWIAAQRDRAA
jgi:predicted DNA-binding transcriptional regulator AlpA